MTMTMTMASLCYRENPARPQTDKHFEHFQNSAALRFHYVMNMIWIACRMVSSVHRQYVLVHRLFSLISKLVCGINSIQMFYNSIQIQSFP